MARRFAFFNNWMSVFLGTVERVGNALPHPATIFAILALAIVVLSGVAATTGLEAIHPGTGETIRPVSLLSIEGLHRILVEMVTNFTGFAPLGTVLVAMLGIGVMEASGLIAAALRLLVLSAPKRLLTFVIVLAGILSNTASEIGYVLLVPLGGIIFLGAGRHPIAGLAAAFAGVSGGYSANLLLGTVDPLLAGLSEEAARIVQPGYTVNPAANYFFMVVSTFVIAAAGTWVTEKIVIPRLGEYRGAEPRSAIDHLSADEWRGLRYTTVVTAIFAGLLLWGTVPADGFLRNPETGSLLRSPFLSGIVAFIFLGGDPRGRGVRCRSAGIHER
jgi:aminobenzoyl-glutamate transport protein